MFLSILVIHSYTFNIRKLLIKQELENDKLNLLNTMLLNSGNGDFTFSVNN